MSAMLPESMNNFMSDLSLHRVGEFANAFDFHRHGVAGGERSDAFLCAGRDDIARFERHDERHEFHEQVDGEDELLCARRLTTVAAHHALARPLLTVP